MALAQFQVTGDILEMSGYDILDASDVERMFTLFAELRVQHPRAFLMAKLGGATMTGEARRIITDWFRATPVPLECVVYGGGVVHRAAIEMTRRAVQFFAPGKMIIASFRTREEAIDWIDDRRRMPLPPAG